LKGRDVVVVAGTEKPQAENLINLLAVIEMTRSKGAESVTVVTPYLAYGRQDREDVPGATPTGPMVVHLLASRGANRVLTIDAHNPTSYDALPIEVISLDPARAKAAWARRSLDLERLVVVSADRGGADRAGAVARLLDVPLVVCDKSKEPNGHTWYAAVGDIDVRGRECLVVDDLASSGSTLVPLVGYLRSEGAVTARVALTHALIDVAILTERVGVPVESCDTIPVSNGSIGSSALVAATLRELAGMPLLTFDQLVRASGASASARPDVGIGAVLEVPTIGKGTAAA
jgi:ribose-phosphate pyrophosphokinase